MMCNNPDVDFINMIAFDNEDIERKGNFGLNQGP